jgi:cell division protease FtsH
VLLTRDERERIAYHESGHTLLGLTVPGADPVTRVTIIPRGRSLGATHQTPTDDRQAHSEAQLRARIIGILGGRAAEDVVFGDRTTAAQNDLQVATSLARAMVTQWGMSSALGPVSLTSEDGQLSGTGPSTWEEGGRQAISEWTARLVDEETRRIIKECDVKAVALVRDHRALLDKLATALLERETLDERDILELTGLPGAVIHG